ncbi:hypothetical protein, partial [Vibrio ichthyoenteri]
MNNIVHFSPKFKYKCDYILTTSLADCTAVIFHNPKTKETSFCHYYTQTIDSEILKKQLDLIERSDNGNEVKAYVAVFFKT